MKIERHSFSRRTPAGVTLTGEITLPPGLKPGEQRPAVLMIAGSGPLDRDETMYDSVSGVNKPFKTIADSLSDAGMIVMRYDKRGIQGPQNGPNVTISEDVWRKATGKELIEDARFLLDELRLDPRTSSTSIVGHSEGTLIAGALAASGAPLAGVALLGAVDNFERVVAHQLKAQGVGLQDFRQQLKDPNNTLYERSGKDAPWYKWWLDNPDNQIASSAAVKNLKSAPVILMCGEQDQATPVDDQTRSLHQRLQAAGIKSDLLTYPGLGHVFSPPASQGEQTYGPLDPSVVNDLTDWARENLLKGKLP